MIPSPRQLLILAFIRAYIDRTGYPPSHEEIRDALGMSTKSLVNYHLECLERAGYLTRARNTPRGIRLDEPLKEAAQL